MNKDQSYGGLIFAVSAIVFIVYLIFLTDPVLRTYAIDIPVVLGVLGILGITGWIGWTMLTTPPPAPLEAEPSTTGASSSKPDEKH
ncbi:transcriptional regulator [Candidatus Bathyarchaeota archaeon]|nr:MAG: transcriptional regulator [Candidatus Bathyarchaeota archaeon]